MIPPFDPATGNLPPRVHEATWDEVVAQLGYTPHRRALLSGLRTALEQLHAFGCRRFYLDGSFVTAKEDPNDYDGCWEAEGVDVSRVALVAPFLWDDTRGRPNQKALFGGDIFPVRSTGLPSERHILDQFQVVYATGQPKGIVALDLEEL